MQQTTGISVGSIKAYGTLSGYVYLHIPQYICKQFNITSATLFNIIIYKDGKIVIERRR